MYYYEISDKSFLEKRGFMLLHNLKYKSFLENKKTQTVDLQCI